MLRKILYHEIILISKSQIFIFIIITQLNFYSLNELGLSIHIRIGLLQSRFNQSVQASQNKQKITILFNCQTNHVFLSQQKRSQKNYRIKDTSVQQLTQTIQKNMNKENYNSRQCNVALPKHTRNPTDLNLMRFDTSPNSQIEISNNSRGNNSQQDNQRKLSFNTPNQTIRTSLPPVNNSEKYRKLALSMKELIQKQKYSYQIGDYEELEVIFEKLDLLCDQL
ncbi:unnamed protein product (macronuclear) [Paramecium tetraurelia]|uniref:Transmembrane protein n=1 Tax=Paramecium tetraurelia TaxID=5888 RepID=A0DT86_PARTE|nr:uncharacterized protein GSPATT00019946001 [Paramecium tetraurelia]CAK86253.1 unnamed protein product [Paramecium tetraurelia]|eukprot:XP_001453650.1 hypothetical protein (macronuclear) [Paramecium tetraurelia strain d4-2]